jgi:hypothetical protein
MLTFILMLPDTAANAAFIKAMEKSAAVYASASTRRVKSSRVHDDSDLVRALADIKDGASLSEIACALGLTTTKFQHAYNLGRALRRCGWRPVRARVDGGFVDRWRRA